MSWKEKTENENRDRRARDRVLSAILAAVTVISGCLASFSGPPASPVEAPQPAAENTETGWHYPSNNVFYSIEADDFAMLLDGSFEISSSYAPGGLSKEYLENCMTLTPEIPFTVEPLGQGRFRVLLENGRNAPRTLVKLTPDPMDEYMTEPFSAWIEPHLAVRAVTEKGYGGAPIDLPFQVEFSVPMDFSGAPEDFITFYPELPCKMEASERTVTVTPDQMLPYAANYTVSISAGLKGAGGETFPVDQELEFATEERDYSFIITDQAASTAGPDDAVELECQLDTAGRGPRSGSAVLYAIDGAHEEAFDQYVAFLKSSPLPDVVYMGKDYDRHNFYYQTGPGAKIPAHMTELDRWDGDFPEGLTTVSFDNPGPGFYIIETTVIDTKTKEPYTLYKPLQVTTPSIYMQSANGEAFFWLNDSATGQALSDYTIRFLRDDFQSELGSAVTDRDGCALLPVARPYWKEDSTRSGSNPGEIAYIFTGFQNERASMTPEEAQRRNSLSTVFAVYDRRGTPVYADTTAALSDAVLKENKYYSFLYLDRALYRPTDEIHFWGFLKPYAHNPAPPPASLTVRFDPDGLDTRLTVQVGADGTYSGVIALDKMVSGDYAVRVEYPLSDSEIRLRKAFFEGSDWGADETVQLVDLEWIEVNEFQKPAYLIETTVEKPVYRWEDEVNVTVSPTFFDGTPAPHMPLECSVFSPSTGNLEAVTNLETDETGKAVYTFRAGDGLRFESDQMWTPKRAYFYVKIVSEGENVTAQGHYNYIPGDVAIRPSVEIDEAENARLTILANNITLDKIRTEDDLEGLINGYYNVDSPDARYDILLGEPADLTVTAKVETGYCRPYDGTYDESRYDYAQDKRILSVDVKNGRAVVENLADMPRRPDTYLRVAATVSYQAGGCTVSDSDSAFNSRVRFESVLDATPKGYSFNVYLNGGTSPVQVRDEYWLRDSLEAGAGDEMRFVLCKDGRELAKPEGRLLYTIVQDEVTEHGVFQGDLRLSEKPEYANSMVLVAAYFDGKDVFPVANCDVSFRKESMRLNLETTAGQESYLPGETVTLTAKVTDGEGKPAAANVCFSVVDEAVFALKEQYFQLLGELYGQMGFYNYFINKYTTGTGDIDPFHAGGDGGKGEGENLLAYDIFRKNFKDTAFFLPTKSDADGNAAVTFRLPDNLTSWRVTTLAVNGLSGGQSRSQVITSIPFFVKPVISSKYLSGDEVSLLVKGHGTALEEGGVVDYTVTVKGGGVDKTQTFQQDAFAGVTASLGKLPEGDYTVTVTGRLGERSDTVELPLSVIHSNLELMVHQAFDPGKPVNFPASRYPVTVTLYNQAYQTYYDSLNALFFYSSNFFSQRMARHVSRQALLRTCDEASLPQRLRAADDLSLFQRDSGGIGRCVQDNDWDAGADPELTAWAMLTVPEEFGKEHAFRYLRQAADDPALNLRQQAAALAGAAAVDPAAAKLIRQRLTAEGVSLEERLWYGIGLAWAGDPEASAIYDEYVTPNLVTRGGVTRIAGIGSSWEDEYASALAWTLAIKLESPDAEPLARYFVQDGWWLGSGLFPCMIYVDRYSMPPSPITFSYTAGGRTGELDLTLNGSATMVLDSAALEGLSFRDVPEEVAGLAYYVGEPEEAGLEMSENITVTKETTPLEGGKFKNVVTVRLTDDAPYGYYGVSDWVPSNCRLHSVQEGGRNNWYSSGDEGQKLYFEFYHWQEDSNSRVITYYTQRTYETEAVQGSVYVTCAENGEMARTEPENIQ